MATPKADSKLNKFSSLIRAGWRGWRWRGIYLAVLVDLAPDLIDPPSATITRTTSDKMQCCAPSWPIAKHTFAICMPSGTRLSLRDIAGNQLLIPRGTAPFFKAESQKGRTKMRAFFLCGKKGEDVLTPRNIPQFLHSRPGLRKLEKAVPIPEGGLHCEHLSLLTLTTLQGAKLGP